VLVVGTGDGEPEEIFRVADTSIWPFVTALGTVGIFASELLKMRVGALVGAAVVVTAALMWNRPSPPPMTEEEELAFEAEHGVPVRASGSLIVARWGMGIAILFLSIAFSSFLLSYFYLRIENPVWPPAGVERPSATIAVSAAALYAGGVVVMVVARRRLLGGDVRGLRAGLAAASVVLAAGGGVLARDLATTPFASSDHSYASIFHTLGGFVVAVTFAALVMSVSTFVYAARGHYSARRFSPVDNVTRFWIASGVIAIVSIVVLYGAPVMTS
jgi:cytochrome c oxidase subunit I+III